jgi:hypothetical protein
MRTSWLLLALPLLLTPPLAAQGGGALARRVAAAPDGHVRFNFPARPGVCGNGENISVHDSRDRNDEWESDCEAGPVRIVLTKTDHAVTNVRAYVGGRWRSTDATDLGAVDAKGAAEYLLALAEQLPGKAGERAIFPATLAEGVTPWPDLLRLAKNDRLPREVRRGAIFWLGQAAGDAATRGLDSIASSDSADREVREAAVFALSQRPHGEGVPALIRVARSDRDPKIRRNALFWLGQSEDPRALALFEELLAGR